MKYLKDILKKYNPIMTEVSTAYDGEKYGHTAASCLHCKTLNVIYVKIVVDEVSSEGKTE